MTFCLQNIQSFADRLGQVIFVRSLTGEGIWRDRCCCAGPLL